MRAFCTQEKSQQHSLHKILIFRVVDYFTGIDNPLGTHGPR